MFDYIIVPLDRLPLEDKEKRDLNGETFQTKDFDCELTEIYITQDGDLKINRWEYKVVPKEERPYPDDDGLLGMAGMLKRVNERLETIPLHGMVRFYAIGKSEEWYEFNAKFTDGKLVEIQRIKDTAQTG